MRQDLEILLGSARQSLEGNALGERLSVPFLDAPASCSSAGCARCSTTRSRPARRAAALVRLRKYAGARAAASRRSPCSPSRRSRARMAKPGLHGPSKAQVERGPRRQRAFLDGIPQLFEKYGSPATRRRSRKLKAQIAAYDDFVRQEILPKARTDFRQPPELYAFALRPVRRRHSARGAREAWRTSAFTEIQNEMQALAPRGREGEGLDRHRLPRRDSRAEEGAARRRRDPAPLPGAARRSSRRSSAREKLVTLPTRPARIRLASAAETAAIPGAQHAAAAADRQHRRAGRVRAAAERARRPDGTTLKTDDFTLRGRLLDADRARGAARPRDAVRGMIETGVSTARALFSFNSTNVEGWGLYAERDRAALHARSKASSSRCSTA